MKTAILISGKGSNLQSILDETEKGRLSIKISLVLSNKVDALGLKKAQNEGIPTHVVSHKDYENREDFDKKITKILEDNKIELIVLAGFMRLFTETFVQKWKGKLINIHPSLLPAFAGLHTHRKAIEYGVKYSGCTAFFVDEGVDTGAIINQAVVPVYSDDTEEQLAKRILQEEHRILPEAIDWVSSGKVKLKKGKAVFKH